MTTPVVGGPNDGAELYAEGQEPCLVCGALVNTDWDGVLCWHMPAVPVVRAGLVLMNWCPGSRKAPMAVPA